MYAQEKIGYLRHNNFHDIFITEESIFESGYSGVFQIRIRNPFKHSLLISLSHTVPYQRSLPCP
jgi:hypothetical protein